MYTTQQKERIHSQDVNLQEKTPPQLIFHRPLTPTEARTLWALLSSAKLSGDQQNLHIHVRYENGTPSIGWVTHTAERSVSSEAFALVSPEPQH
jgi:hypothetical protein